LVRALTTNRSKGETIMSTQEPVQRIAIVGTGTIGASWATHYLAQGLDVTATDPAPGAEAALRSYVEGAWEGDPTSRVHGKG
jgi:3-hydroxyacyl-CoA dehydrogenase